MTTTISAGAVLAKVTGLAPMLSVALLKSSLLLIVVFGLAGLMRRTSAATRHLVWSLGLVGVLLIPLLSETLPWHWGVLPATQVQPEPAQVPAMSGSQGLKAIEGIEPPVTSELKQDQPRAGVFFQPASDQPIDPAVMSEEATPIPASANGPATFALNSGNVARGLLAVWLAGSVLLLGWILLGALLVRRMVRGGTPLRDYAWIQLLQDLSEEMDITTPVRLVRSSVLPMPVTAGVIAPVVILPDSAEQWDADRRRAVLLHELAHVRRHDLVFHMISRLATALYWFNPLVWYASRKLRAESERACDDLVIESGTFASDYADHLLQIVRQAGLARTPAVAVPMAQRSEFEGRLLAILEPGIKRHGLTFAKGLGITALLAFSTVPLSIVGRAQAETLNLAAITQAPPSAASSQTPTEEIAVAAQDEEAMKTFASLDESPGIELESLPLGPVDEGDDESTAAVTTQPASQNAGPDRTATLMAALDDSDQGVRLAALESLAELEDPRAVPAMLTALDSEYPEMRRVALHALANSGDARALPGALRMLNDQDREVRVSAAMAVGEFGDSTAIAALSQALGTDSDPEVRKTAAWALGELGDSRAIPALSQALRSDASVEVRRTAAWALGEIEDPAALDGLGVALNDESIEVRRTAIEALGEIDDRRAVPMLMPLLDDPDPEVRRLAVWAFAELEDPATIDALGKATLDESVEVRRMAVYALGELEDVRAFDYLIPMLNDPDVEVRARTVWALGEIEDPRALDALAGALSDESDEVRIRAAHSLGHLEDPRAAVPLTLALADPNVKVRMEAADALGDLELATAPPALISALSDTSPDVRKVAAHSLGHIGDPAAVEALAVAVNDPNREVRMEALEALGEIGTERSMTVLIEAMSDEDPEVRRIAARMLGQSSDR
jgi:HEAT repeat protein/beta-lactamase regulating signal transducer with metallopeptidase domain